MQVNGVSPGGKELELFPGLSLQIPFGAVYARNEDGNWDLSMPRSAPRGYRDGPFELDDEAETAWKLSDFRQVFSGTIEAPRDQAAKAAAENLEELAQKLTEDQDQSESDEDRYTFDVDEKEDGLTFQADFSTAQAGGSYEKPVTRGNVTLCVVHQRMRVMRFHITVSHLLAAVADYPQVRFYIAGLGVPDEEKRQEVLDKGLFPMLFTLNFTAPPSLYDLLGKKPEELFPAAVQSLNFAAGETVEAGEFAVTIPEGLHYTRTENPETRIFTAIPREIPFDAEDFWAYSAVALTLQTGAPIVNIHAPLDTADGEKEVELILQSLSISDSSSAGQTAAGKTTRAARSPDHYICYELIDDNDVDMNFRYYVFTKSFLYAGQYVGKKAGLGPDCSKIHTGLLETYLQGFRYTGGGEKLLEDAGHRALGRYAGSDGRMDALKAVQLFNLDVLFFPDGAFSWDGTHHVFTGIHLNAEKAAEYPDVKDHLDEIGKAVQALVNECEQDERLRVPAAKLGADLRRFLNGADLTGAALFHLAAYHLFWFKEDEEAPGRFSILVDTRLKNTIPNSTEYFRAFLEILRAYNGDPAPEVPGPATVFRAADIPDIFEDGGPCLAGSDGDASGDEGDEEYQDILGILQGSMDSVDLSGLSESDQDDLQAAMQRIAGNLQALNHAVKGDAKSVPANGGKSAGKRDLGRFAGDDGRLDAFMGVNFFTEDVIFFHPEDLLWDGKRHSFANYRFNSAVLPYAEGVMEHSGAILEGLKELIAELEENPELRVPAEDMHPEMRRFLKGADFTPAVVFYMECFQFFRFWEEEPDKYQFRLEERLANSFYNEATNGDLQYPYFEKFIGALRAYNGNHKPYTASCGGTYGGQTGEHLPDIKVYKYELDEDGFLKEDENGDFVYRKKTPEELAWEARMAKKAVEAKLAKVPFDRVSSVTVSGSAFVLTGDFEKSPEDRDAVKRLIEAKGGRCTGSISGKTNYLVIGALGGFGERKIEQVQEQRAKGKDIKIIREADLMAALEGRTPPPPKPGPKPAPKPAPAKPAPKPAPAKPAPKPVPRSTPAKKSGEGSVRIEKIEPEDGEFLRMRVTVDIPGLTDDEPAPPPKPKKRAQVDENEKKQLRAQREEAEKKSEAACSEAVKKGEETRRQLDSRIDEIKRDLDAQEQRLQSLGIFKMGEKKLARQEIARLNQELSQAQQELSGFLQKLEKELVNIRGRYLKAVVEKVRKAACGYLFDCKLPPKEETVVFSILKMLDETPKSRSELMDEFYYSFGSADSSRLLVGKAFMNPFVQNGKLQRITADGSVKTLSGYYF